MSRKLLICTTPLQMVIGGRILDKIDADWDLVLFTKNENPKYHFYYWKLSVNVKNNSFVKLNDNTSSLSIIWNFLKIFYFSLKFSSHQYDGVYLASIDSPYLHLFLSKLRYKKMFTFDDGSANINYKGIYYIENNISKSLKSLLTLLGNKFSQKRIKSESDIHFTLYKDKRNIIPNTEYLTLDSGMFFGEDETDVSIFLGQPFKELNEKYDTRFIGELLKSLNVNYYFPHPREKKLKEWENARIIKSELIFEDYIINCLSKNRKMKIRIYSFFSTAAINLSSIESIECIFLYSGKSDTHLLDLVKGLGKTIDIDNF